MPDRSEDFSLPGTLPGDGNDYLAGEVSEQVAALQAEFKKRNELYQAIDETLFSEYKVEIPKNYQASATETRSPLALHIANTVAAALSINPQQIGFEPVGRGQGALDNAKLREHFFEASWNRQQQEARRQLLRLFLRSLVTKGEGVLKTVERKKRAWGGLARYAAQRKAQLDQEYPDLDAGSRSAMWDKDTEAYKQGAPYPIATTDVPPENFYYWLTEDGFSVCAEVKKVPYLQTLERYGMGLNARGQVVPEAIGLPRANWQSVMAGVRELTMTEYWRWDRCVYTLTGPAGGRGTVAKSLKHGYGDRWTKTLRGPYFHALGITTESRLPEKAGLGVLYGFLSLFPALDQYLTIQSNAGFLYGFPAFKRVTPPGAQLPAAPFGNDGTEAEGALTKVEPGTVLPWDVAPVDMPRGGVDLDKIIAQIRGFVELALPSVVQGVTSGDESGYALNQAAHLARLAWDPIVKNAEYALAERVGFESWLIDHKVRQRVYAFGAQPVPGAKTRMQKPSRGWLGLGPDELSGVHRYTVQLKPETPSNRVLEIRAQTELLQAGLTTEAMAIEELGYDPSEVERGRLLQAMKRDPVILERLRNRTMQLLGLADRKAMVGSANQADVTQGPTSPGAPAPGGPGLAGGAPNVFSPGQGMPLQPTPPAAAQGPGLAGAAPMPSSPPATHNPLPGQ